MWQVWGTGEVHTGCWWGDLMERVHLEDPGLDGSVILKLILKKRNGGMERIDLVQDGNMYSVIFNAVMNLQFP
jgi:hypothetical protein